MSRVEEMSGPSATLPGVDFDAVVVGAGFAGMYMLHRLRQLGLSVRVYETGDGVGGTWYWNRYPGARVDVPSLSYSYSFSPELQQEWCWPETYSSQKELLKYANHVADRFGLRRDIQFETTVNQATYDEGDQVLGDPDRPRRPGHRPVSDHRGRMPLSDQRARLPRAWHSFQGSWYHTSRWPKEGVDLAGKTVGVIGTGSTGIQAVPVIAEKAVAPLRVPAHPQLQPANGQPADGCRRRA